MTDDSRLPRYTPAVPPLDTDHMPLARSRQKPQVSGDSQAKAQP